MEPRAITGLGVASALGIGGPNELGRAFNAALRLNGNYGEARPPIGSFDASKYDSPAIVEVPSFDPTQHLGDKGLRTLDRLTKLLLVAARLSLADAGLKTYADTKSREASWTSLSGDRVGVCCSNAYGSLEAITELDRVAVLEDARYINPAKFPNTVSNTASGYVSIWEDLRALNVSVSDGNCGALDAVSCADIFLATGRADAILTGGGESMSEALFLAFDKLSVKNDAGANANANQSLGVKPPSDPTKLGEGAAFLVLEPMENAKARGARVLATVTGYGTAFIAPKDDVTLLYASGETLERAIRQALEDAGITAKDVDLVVSGAAGIDPFDREERGAIENVLGASTPVIEPKKYFGETLGAGGALAMAAGVVWLADDANAKTTHILVTSVGYYGNASALVMRRA